MAKPDVYGACDKAIKAMNRENLDAFGKLKGQKWDELNVIATVVKLYERMRKRARQKYYEAGFEAYLLALALCDVDSRTAHRMAEEAITGEWVDEILNMPDPVALYIFNEEAQRKAYRLAEAIEAGGNVPTEIDKALRYWVRQLGQFAINVTDYAMMKAYEDAGVEEVVWNSVPDEKRCEVCRERDGKVYRLDEVPGKHPGCRCWVSPAK